MENIQPIIEPQGDFPQKDTNPPVPNRNPVRKIIIIVFLVILLVGLVAIFSIVVQKKNKNDLASTTNSASQLDKEINLTTTLLATIPKEYIDQKYDVRGNFLDYGKGVYWYAYSKIEEEMPHMVVINGDTNNKTEHYNILSGDLEKPFIYINREGKLVVNGTKWEHSVRHTDHFAIGKTGKIVAHMTKTAEDKRQIVVNGKASRDYSGFAGVSISDDEQHIAYMAYEGGKSFKPEKVFLVLDEQEYLLNYNMVSKPVFSPNGERIAYAAARIVGSNYQNDSQCFIVIDEKEHPLKCSENFLMSLAYGAGVEFIEFSPDSKRIAYVVFEGNDIYLNVDGKKYSSSGAFSFSPDSSSIAYVLYDMAAKKASVAVDGVEVKSSGSVKEIYGQSKVIIWSPDSKKLAYSSNKGSYNENALVIATRQGIDWESQSYHEISGVRFSPDGKKVVYLAESIVDMGKSGTVTILGNDKSGIVKTDLIDAYSGKVLAEWSDDSVFSNDSQSIASVVMSDEKNDRGWFKKQVIINGKRSEAYDEIWTNPKFSLDGKSVGYGALKGNELWWIVDNVN